MNSYHLIRQLTVLIEEMEAENPKQPISIHDFAGFLFNKVGIFSSNSPNNEVRFGDHDSAALDIAYQLEIGRAHV